MNKKALSEPDICSKFITPAIKAAAWYAPTQIREKFSLVARRNASRTDYLLFYKPNIPIAVIEAKDNTHTVGAGLQRPLDYLVRWSPFTMPSENTLVAQVAAEVVGLPLS